MLKDHKFSLIIFGIIVITALIMRIIPQEGHWTCTDSGWVAEGKVKTSMPTSSCPFVLDTDLVSENDNQELLLGSDRDEHGCILSAGYSWCESKDKCFRPFEEDCPQLGEALTLEDRPRLVKPQPNEIISSPYEVSGLAPGSWFFEASFPLILLDSDYNEIVSLPATALSDWMSPDLVPFSATLNFETTATSGYLLLKKDNPSGLPEHDGEYRQPLRFR